MKTLAAILIVVLIAAGIVMVGYLNKPPQQIPEALKNAFAEAGVPTGPAIFFELNYRGITGKKNDLSAYWGYGFGTSDEEPSAFIKAVQQQTANSIVVFRNPYLKDQPQTAVECKDRQILAVYFDLNGDGAVSAEERLTPTQVSEENRRGNDTVVFLSPDFMVTRPTGEKTPFRLMFWAAFYGQENQPYLTWSPAGLYEGAAIINEKKMRFYLFPDFSEQSYAAFGASQYGMRPAAEKKQDYLPRQSLSSLIVCDGTFYRVLVRPDEQNSERLFVLLAEDKGPRGRIAFKVAGKDGLNVRVNNANLRSPQDNTVCFDMTGDMQDVPAGDYMISSGYLNYGAGQPDGYSASFTGIPAFSIRDGQTTTVEFGRPEMKLRAIEETLRYNSNKEYKTAFAQGTPVYIDLTFTGMAGETYRGFQQRVQRENYVTFDYVKAHLEITDAAKNVVLSEDMEYG